MIGDKEIKSEKEQYNSKNHRRQNKIDQALEVRIIKKHQAPKFSVRSIRYRKLEECMKVFVVLTPWILIVWRETPS